MKSFDSQWQRWFPEEKDGQSAPPGKTGRATNRVLLLIAGGLILFIILNILKGIYVEWLWFNNLGYDTAYTTILKTKLLIFFSTTATFAVIFIGNLILATYLAPKNKQNIWPWAIVRRLKRVSRWGIIMGTTLLSIIFGLTAQSSWQMILEFFNKQPFGITDPVFHREISFYVFSLPFFEGIQNWFLGATIIIFLSSIAIYLLSYLVQRMNFDFTKPVLAHLGGLLIIIFGLFAWDYWLGIWNLVFSERGVVFGASYADMHAKLPAQWILISIVAICAIIALFAIVRRQTRWVYYGIGGWVVSTIIVGGIFPSAVQRFQVQPNELVREMPYIEYNIQATIEAFALDRIEEQSFLAEDTPTLEDIIEGKTTINNIRLWDHRPLKNTYNQLQSFRLYYNFNDIDVDRYIINGEYRQVMLSARELSAEELAGEAQTWVNRKLQFTHGYGLALSPVNEISPQGQPVLLVKDIPPIGDLDIDQPQIYFGEKTNDYVILKTNTQEFDYPTGTENVYGQYQGQGGVVLDSFMRRLIFAWQFGDLNILISGELNPESRISYYRNIQSRISHLAPFLKLDSDPYLVINDGKLFWIQDAYTTTNRYPYSEPIGDINYIRNSVKVVIDAYNGSARFYITDPEDALIQTYQSIFPNLFLSAEEMPDSIRIHLRYPESMFNVQASVYSTYHMRDPRVFYNKEDLWTIPMEVYAETEQVMEPYYTIMRMPDELEEEFLLMLPFTPVNKNNTIGWLAARCDGEHYGTLRAYLFPKDRLVYGPSQIENRIGQDTVVTEQLALWSRGGSRVIRGNLLLIPMGKSILYVEPVFLEAETGGLPELKRIIVVAGDQIAMEPSLQESLAAIFGEGEALPEIERPQQEETVASNIIINLIEEAQLHYQKALEHSQAGDWASYGEELAALETALQQLAELIAPSK
ncbi:UPF0182 family protein [Chloroflexota bacterium]